MLCGSTKNAADPVPFHKFGSDRNQPCLALNYHRMEREKAVEELAARCEAAPGSVVTALLGRLRPRADELARLVRGEPLRIELAVTGWTVHDAWIVVSPLGNVAAVTDRSLLGAEGRPHILFRGPPDDILRVVLGLTRLDNAVAAGVFIPLVPVARFKRLMQLVGRELLRIADPEG